MGHDGPCSNEAGHAELWKAIEEYGAATYDSRDEPGAAARARERINALLTAGARPETPVVCSHPVARVSDYSTIGGIGLRWCASCGALHDEDGWTMPTGGVAGGGK
jgi:hypothetical protein